MNRLKVLLADDHDGFRRTLAGFLSQQHGVEVVAEAVDGNEAVAQAEKHRPDLILIDVHMPHRNGFDATRAIKSRFPAIKVVMLSLSNSQMYRHMAEESQADGYIEKSSVKTELLVLLAHFTTQRFGNAVAA